MSDVNRRNSDGFSLIEMIIAIAIVGIVMSGVVLLISYSTNSMRRTSNMVNLQNQAKDAMLHMTTYMQEASDVYWDDTNKALIVVNKNDSNDGTVGSLDVSYYWIRPKDLAEPGFVSGMDSSLVFVKDVVDFNVDIKNKKYEVTTDSPVMTSGAVATISPTDVPEYVLCFYKWTTTDVYSAMDIYGKIDFSKLGLDYEHFNAPPAGEDPPIFLTGSVVTPFVSPGGAHVTPTATPLIKKIGGKSAVVTLKLKNENGDADFICVKEVYLRNQ